MELLPIALPSSKKENFVSTSKYFPKNRIFFAVVRYFTWKLEFVSYILWIIVSGNSFLFLAHPTPLQVSFA